MDIKSYMQTVGRNARAASRAMAAASTGAKNQALLAMARLIRKRSESLLSANRQDLEQARVDGLESAIEKARRAGEGKSGA